MDSAYGGQWQCPRCTLINIGGSSRCDACGHVLPTQQFASPGPGGWEGQQGGYASTARAATETGAGDSWTSLEKDELRVVLLGHTGCGKSATGNTILNQNKFQSMASAKGVTAMTRQASVHRFGRPVLVVDTPGLFDPCMINEKVIREITKCFGMTSPGPHAFIMVVSIGRFTKEEKDTVEEFKKYFGPFMTKYLLVLFTRTDDLEERPLSDYVRNVPEGLAELLQSCNHRYIGFNNKAAPGQKEQQVKDLLRKIDAMVQSNGGTCFTNEMYQEAEKAMRKREKIIRDNMERKKRADIERIELENAKKLSEVQEKYQQMMNKMKDKMKDLESSQSQARGDERAGVSNEIKELRDQIQRMNKEKEQQEKERLRENSRRVEELEAKFHNMEESTRAKAREEVEKEEEGFGLVWKGIKDVAKGIFQGFKKLIF